MPLKRHSSFLEIIYSLLVNHIWSNDLFRTLNRLWLGLESKPALFYSGLELEWKDLRRTQDLQSNAFILPLFTAGKILFLRTYTFSLFRFILVSYSDGVCQIRLSVVFCSLIYQNEDKKPNQGSLEDLSQDQTDEALFASEPINIQRKSPMVRNRKAGSMEVPSCSFTLD